MLLVLLLVILVFGVGGGAWYGPRSGWSGYQYGGGGIGLILIVLLVLFLFGGLRY